MKHVLIVAPRFAPSNAADSHRVRQSLPYYREAGWEPVVLAVEADEVAAPQDPLLLDTLPADVEVVRVGAIPQAMTRRLGFGSLEARSFYSLAKAGRRLLRERPFDLVFFDDGHDAHGPRASVEEEFGVPFVIDLQDPWLSEYYNRVGPLRRPGER